MSTPIYGKSGVIKKKGASLAYLEDIRLAVDVDPILLRHLGDRWPTRILDGSRTVRGEIRRLYSASTDVLDEILNGSELTIEVYPEGETPGTRVFTIPGALIQSWGYSQPYNDYTREDVRFIGKNLVSTLYGLVGWWRFDEGVGSIAYDSSGYNHHGTIYGALWDDGKYGKALQFDGVDDWVGCGNIQPLGQQFTVMLWSYRLGSTGAYGSLLSIDELSWSTTGGFMFLDYNAGLITGGIRNHPLGVETSVALEAFVPNNVWRHYAVTWDKPYLKGYRDGVLVDQETFNYDVGWNVYETRIAKWVCNYFYGVIDEVRVFRGALSEALIRRLM